MEGDNWEYKNDNMYTKVLDATDLSGTRDKEASPLARTFEAMLKSVVPEKRNDEQERDKVPFLIMRKIRNAILNETFKPGDIVKPLSAEETLDIAEVRLALITLAAKGAYRHLSPADFDLAFGLGKQITLSSASC